MAQELADSATATALAVDTESNSFYVYRERICLIQLATVDETILLDPLAVKDLSYLGELLAAPGVTKTLHGSDYDLRSFDRDYGYHIAPLFDTALAARFLGVLSPNLASVLRAFLGVEIPKSHKVQRSNWAIRPLDRQMMEYSASDVQHLLLLTDELRRRLTERHRLEWVLEECSRLEQTRFSNHVSRENAFLAIKGSDRLNPRSLAVLKELAALRDAEARRIDQAPFRILSNETLLFLAERPDTSLSRVPCLSTRWAERGEGQIRAAIGRGLSGPEFRRPRLPGQANPWTPEAKAALQRLKQWRKGRAESLGLDPPLIWPTTSLERLALNPDSWEAELGPKIQEDGATSGVWEVREWQRRLLAGDLKHFLEET